MTYWDSAAASRGARFWGLILSAWQALPIYCKALLPVFGLTAPVILHRACTCIFPFPWFALLLTQDEDLFPFGFGEENDFALRAGQAGWKRVVVPSTYIFHHKTKSYTVRAHSN